MMTIALISLGAVNLALVVLLVQMSRRLEMFAKPQRRGAFGEFALERLLADHFGELYALQHPLPDGTRVDAAIFVRDQFVAVDSKFPHDVSQVRNRAKEIASKYIQPPLTLDFAFLFVPSESLYLEILEDARLHEDLLRMRVIPTSPNSLYAYLQTMAAAFRGMRIERNSVEIQRAVIQIAKDYAKYMGDYTKLGEKLEQAAKAYRDSIRDAERLTHRFESLQLGEPVSRE